MTDRGNALAELVSGIRLWAYATMDDIESSRREFDERTA
jgi:hypothetical protein